MTRRALHAALAVAATAMALAAVPAGAGAQAVIGLGETRTSVFADPNFQELGIRTVRTVIPYDAVLQGGWERDDVDAYMGAAAAAGIDVFVAFNHSRHTSAAPTLAQYRAAIQAFHDRYPQVTLVTAWNEPNHPSQPTWDKPWLAALYTNEARKVFAGGTIVAGDVLDAGAVLNWLSVYRLFLTQAPEIWGMHGYGDANRFRPFADSVLKKLLDTLPGQLWETETGGIVRFSAAFPYDPERAARAIQYAFDLADADPRVTRLYLYNWYGEPVGARWDSGLVDPDGTPRPGLDVVRARLGVPAPSPAP